MSNLLRNLQCFGSVAILCLGASVAHSATFPSNPGFETGDLTDWGFSSPGTTVVSDNGPSGAGIFAVDQTITAGHQQAVSKALAISPGQPIDLSFDFKTIGATGNPQVLLRYWDGVGANGYSDGSGSNFMGQHVVTLPLTDGAWNTKADTALPYFAGATHVEIALFANAFTGFSGSVRYDNFFVIPEPTALSLLCLGGIAMLYRRR